MQDKRIVITGLGILAPNAIGRAAFSEALVNGTSGIRPITLFDTAGLKVKTAGELQGFDAGAILGPKGLRTLDRSTRLVSSAAQLAINDGGFVVTPENADETGVVVGNTLGSISSIMGFDRIALTEGPQYVNPSLFSNTVINSPASQVSLRFNIRGLNSTISTGWSASLDALRYACSFLKLQRLKIILAGAVEELCLELYLGFYKSRCLAGLKDGSLELSCPFDQRRNGILPAEGSCILILEELGSALGRKAVIYGEIKGIGSALGRDRLKKAMTSSLLGAGLLADDIDYISCAANSSLELDQEEAAAIRELFPRRPPVTALKAMLGECFSASGALQTAAALISLREGFIPATINYFQKDPLCDLNVVGDKPLRCPLRNILINSAGAFGLSSSLIVSKFNG